MVVMDATVLMLLLHPAAGVPNDSSTGLPLERCKDRIEYLLKQLNESRTRVIVPTPALSEVLVGVGAAKADVLTKLDKSYSFTIMPFEERAAMEVALFTDTDRASSGALPREQTIAKVKYDRQIVAIAKVNGVTSIYSDDGHMEKLALSVGIRVIKTEALPLPPIEHSNQMQLNGLDNGGSND